MIARHWRRRPACAAERIQLLENAYRQSKASSEDRGDIAQAIPRISWSFHHTRNTVEEVSDLSPGLVVTNIQASILPTSGGNEQTVEITSQFEGCVVLEIQLTTAVCYDSLLILGNSGRRLYFCHSYRK